MSKAGRFRDGLVARLKYLIELRGRSVSQVEKDLGRSRGFLGDALRGGKRLPIETILEVLELLQVDPESFFAGATANEREWGGYRRSPVAGAEVADGELDPLRRMRDDLGDGSIAVEEVARALSAVVRLLDEKGYLSREELRTALARRPSRSRS